MAMEYKKTLNITLSDKDPGAMPQRANLPAREPEIQQYWKEIDLYRLSLEKDAPRGTFILHDGPPYSNGDVHLGTALNKICKDIVVKYKTMAGFRSPYVPGWDNHGMPIENNVSREFRRRGEQPDKVTMRKACREYAARFVESQKKQFRRLGVRGDWNNPYLTMSTDFEAKIVEVFGELAERGYIYRGLKPVLWCAYCETALADAEVEYENHVSKSIYVRFPVKVDPSGAFGGSKDAYVLIWTTTPWTLPANMALAVHPEADYVVFEVDSALYLVAEPLLGRVLRALYPPVEKDAPIERAADSEGPLYSYVYNRDGEHATLDADVVCRLKGSALEGVVARHPLFERDSPVVFADYVTMDDGTGIVHTAPGHGKEDFDTGVREGLEILCPIDASGTYTSQAGERFQGAKILSGDADARVIEALREAGALMSLSDFEHSYPHCWRCHNPLLFRATVQWFMNIDHVTNDEKRKTKNENNDPSPRNNQSTHRDRSLAAIQQVKWYPGVSINRISSMVANRPDWTLSRQRAWGVGIPAFYCKGCGKETLSKEAIQAVAALVRREGSDAWYARPAAEILPAGFACGECGAREFEKETDILDVWFDSGSTHMAVLENKERWPELSWPADMYLEGSDQHRGWFNSSLMTSVGIRGVAPYREVVTNGFTVDENGRKMSKSLGNVVDPLKTMEKYGADILRLWVASVNYFEDVSCSESILEQVAGVTMVNGRPVGTGGYWRIRNTFRFLVNNLYDFDPDADSVSESDMLELDRWALARLDQVVAACAAGYDTYEFHRVFHAVLNFCTVELSAFYLDVLKDRLYCEGKKSPERRSAQTALFTMAETMSRLLAPVLSHTSEEVWELLKQRGRKPSPQLADFPTAQPNNHVALIERWAPILETREAVSLAVESARHKGTVTNPLEARVEIRADSSMFYVLSEARTDLAAVFKVSQLSLSEQSDKQDLALNILVAPAAGAKCARCWLFKEDVGVDSTYNDLCGRCARVVADIEK